MRFNVVDDQNQCQLRLIHLTGLYPLECPYRNMIEMNHTEDDEYEEGSENIQSMCQINSTALALITNIIQQCTAIESIELIGKSEIGFLF